jgi:hypothetical protein
MMSCALAKPVAASNQLEAVTDLSLRSTQPTRNVASSAGAAALCEQQSGRPEGRPLLKSA